ncbi:MAG: glycosyltransferase family 2 protein [Candidatus Pacebacteria bacterium]|nr:glycosyltransferase family 2 protein [Candidatus Paceibacterota bacterium]
MISVIIPVYNQAKELKETLKSLIKQSYQDLEIIIVNDGSSDGVEKVFQDFISQQETSLSFYFLNNNKNLGAPATRNKGWSKSSGNYLFFCDADAVLKPEALEVMLNALNTNSQASYVYSSFKWGRKLFKVGEFKAEKLKTEPYIHTMSLIKREDFPEKGWDEKIKKFQDWDLFLTMLEQGKTGVWVDKVLFTVKPGGTMSYWLPSFAYKLLPFLPAVKKYKQAKQVIKNKHSL